MRTLNVDKLAMYSAVIGLLANMTGEALRFPVVGGTGGFLLLAVLILYTLRMVALCFQIGWTVLAKAVSEMISNRPSRGNDTEDPS